MLTAHFNRRNFPHAFVAMRQPCTRTPIIQEDTMAFVIIIIFFGLVIVIGVIVQELNAQAKKDGEGCATLFLGVVGLACLIGFGIWMSQTNSGNLSNNVQVDPAFVANAVAATMAAKQVVPPQPIAGSNVSPRISVPAPAAPAPVPAVSNPAPQPALLPCFTTNMAGGYGTILNGPIDGGPTWGMQIRFNRHFSKGGWSNLQVIEINSNQSMFEVFPSQIATLWFFKNC